MTATPLKSPATISVPEAGTVLGIGRSKAYELARMGEFPVRVLKVGSRYRVSRADLDRFLGVPEATELRKAQ